MSWTILSSLFADIDFVKYSWSLLFANWLKLKAKKGLSPKLHFEGNPSKDAQIWDEAFAQAVAALCYPILSGEKLFGFITLFFTEK
jgi:hypothetical protein